MLDHCRNPEQDKRILLQGIVFNYLIGNADAHAKNISLLYEAPPKPRLAPFHDLVCTAVYPGINKKLASNIGRKKDPGRIHRPDWQTLCAQACVPFAEATNNILGMCSTLESILQPTTELFIEQYGIIPIIPNIVAVIRERLNLLKTALADSA